MAYVKKDPSDTEVIVFYGNGKYGSTVEVIKGRLFLTPPKELEKNLEETTDRINSVKLMASRTYKPKFDLKTYNVYQSLLDIEKRNPNSIKLYEHEDKNGDRRLYMMRLEFISVGKGRKCGLALSGGTKFVKFVGYGDCYFEALDGMIENFEDMIGRVIKKHDVMEAKKKDRKSK